MSNSTRLTARPVPVVLSVLKPASGARMLTLHPNAQQNLALQEARLRQNAPDFKERYAKRAGIEGTLSEARS
jgi:hypothetical protein